jgi:GNAT superfamily N-acetyltransferase
MTWELTDDVERFAETAGDFLRSRPVPHTVLLTLVDSVRRQGPHAYGRGDPVFGWWRTSVGAVGGVLLQTPPRPVMFSEIPPEAVPAAVAALADRPLPGVNVVADVAEVFGEEWRRRTGATITMGLRSRLHRLETLIPPAEPPPGTARTADGADRDLLLRWVRAFHGAIGEEEGDLGANVDDRISYGAATLWEVDGEPVSMAMRSRPAAGMIRVQLVYTPAELRGHGYAGAATSAATEAALAAGARDVVLFTDLANPISNWIYRKLGYRPVEDRTVVQFS